LLCRTAFSGGVEFILSALHPLPSSVARWRSQPCFASCSFSRAMAIATSSASRRSSIRVSVSLRNRIRLRIRSRAALYSSSSLACSGQETVRAEGEHMEHLLKTSWKNVAGRRKKSKYYFRLRFAGDSPVQDVPRLLRFTLPCSALHLAGACHAYAAFYDYNQSPDGRDFVLMLVSLILCRRWSFGTRPSSQ
jgi:hypothetical protein